MKLSNVIIAMIATTVNANAERSLTLTSETGSGTVALSSSMINNLDPSVNEHKITAPIVRKLQAEDSSSNR